MSSDPLIRSSEDIFQSLRMLSTGQSVWDPTTAATITSIWAPRLAALQARASWSNSAHAYYLYAACSPSLVADSLGLFLPEGHNIILELAFPNMDGETRRILQQASLDMDDPSGIHYGDNSQHAMKGPGQTDAQAKEATQKWLDGQRDKAANDICKGKEAAAKYNMGLAFHTLADSLSPTHRDSQGNPLVWDDSASLMSKGLHVAGEDTNTALAAARKAEALFENFRREVWEEVCKKCPEKFPGVCGYTYCNARE